MEIKNLEILGIDNLMFDGLVFYLFKYLLYMDFNINEKNFY